MGAMKTFALTLLFVPALLFAGAAHAQGTSSLKQQMPPAVFHAAGLDTLTPAQLHTLEHWLRHHPLKAAAARPAPSADAMGADQLKKPDREPSSIHQVIKAPRPFHGWHHGSVITLANGQQWKVVDDSSLYVPGPKHPVAVIHHGFMGSYLLKLKGYNAVAHVRRIR